MKKIFRIFTVFFLAVLLFLGGLYWAYDFPPDLLYALTPAAPAVAFDESEIASRSGEAISQGMSKTERIIAEMAATKDHSWMGHYRTDGFLSGFINLYLMPESGFTISEWGDIFHYKNHGDFVFKDRRLKLIYTFDNVRYTLPGGERVLLFPEEYTLVPWGARLYLISSDRMLGFCNDVNAGWEPRREARGGHLMRNGDWEKKVAGFPDVPAEYVPYLLKRTVRAKVIHVAETEKILKSDPLFSRQETRVTVNRGKNAGLLPGMELRFVDGSGLYDHLELDRVDETQAEGVVKQNLGRLLPKVGMRLSSRRR